MPVFEVFERLELETTRIRTRVFQHRRLLKRKTLGRVLNKYSYRIRRDSRLIIGLFRLNLLRIKI